MRIEYRPLIEQIDLPSIVLFLCFILYPFHIGLNTTFGALNASLGDLVIGIVILLWVMGVFGEDDLPIHFIILAGCMVLAALFTTFAIYSNNRYVDVSQSAFAFIKITGCIAWFLAIYLALSESLHRRLNIIALTSVIVATIFSIITIYNGMVVGELRPTGPFQNPNIYGNYIVLNIAFSLYLLSNGDYSREKMRNGFFLLTIPVLITALIVTASRGSMIGILIASVVVFPVILTWYKKTIVNPLSLAVTSLLFLTVSITFGTNAWIRNRIFDSFSLSGKNVETRIVRWRYAVNAILDRPLTGVGFGQSPNYIGYYGFEGELITAHNTILTILSEVGFIGAIAFYLFFGLAIVHAFEISKIDRSYLAFLWFLIAIHAEGIVTDILNFRSLWIALGIVVAAKHTHSKQSSRL